MQDAFIDRGEESFGEAVLAGSATDWSVLNIVQEALNCAETVDFKDQSWWVRESLRGVDTRKRLRSDRKKDIWGQSLIVGKGKRSSSRVDLGLILEPNCDLGMEVLEELRSNEITSLIVSLNDSLCEQIIVIFGAEISGKLSVHNLIVSGSLERYSIHIGPGEIVTELIGGDLLPHNVFVDFRIGLAKSSVQSSIDLSKQGLCEVLVDWAVLLVYWEKHVFFEACLLDGEGLETEGQGKSAELLLPLREIGTFNGRDGVTLLPFSEVVGMSPGVQAHHLRLQGEDVFRHKRSLEGNLGYNVIGREYFGFFYVAESQLRSNQELLALSEWCDPVRILWLLAGVHSHVKTNYRRWKSRGIKCDDKIYVATLSRDISLSLCNSRNKSERERWPKHFSY